MFGRFIKLSKHIYLPLGWTILTQILLCIPGAIFPGGGLFTIPHLDKIAHVILWAGLNFFWIAYFYSRNRHLTWLNRWLIGMIMIAYGIGMEYFQVNFIPNRSFDKGDIVADIAGSLLGYVLSIVFIRSREKEKNTQKNKPL